MENANIKFLSSRLVLWALRAVPLPKSSRTATHQIRTAAMEATPPCTSNTLPSMALRRLLSSRANLLRRRVKTEMSAGVWGDRDACKDMYIQLWFSLLPAFLVSAAMMTISIHGFKLSTVIAGVPIG